MSFPSTMSSDELSLTWDDHHNTLVEVFGKLLRTSSLVDCTIAAEGQYIKAHKIVLSACSPYFELLFNQENEKNPIVVLKDIKFQELKAIIDFIYCGKVRVPEDHLGDFVDAAESLQIKGLGSDNYKTLSSGRTSEGSESPHLPKQEFSDSGSPVPRKRRRPISINKDYVSEISSGTIVNDEYQSIERVPQGQIQVDRLGHQIGQHSSIASASNSLCSASVTLHRVQRTVETDSRASFMEPSPPSPPPPSLEMLPNFDAMVIKTEPEPIAEVCLPDMDFEPKGEEDVEDTIVLDSDDEVPGAVLNEDTQSSSNQYTAYVSAPQTAAASSDNAFLMTDVAEHTSTQGMVETYARRGRRLPPTMAMRKADFSLGGILASPVCHPSAAVASVAASISTAPPVSAPVCSSGTAGRSARKRHGCHVCGETFLSPSDLARHQRLHTGDRPYKCKLCCRTFKRMYHLQVHMQIHSGERPFKCVRCGKAFKRMETMQTHQRIHTGERPYRCDECGVTTAHRAGLYNHMRKVHSAAPAKRRGPRD